MTIFTVNGLQIQTTEKTRLLNFLRDTLRLTSVKNGCAEGACGACMVLIDNRAVKACIPRLDTLNGKSVLTVEGLSDHEKEVYSNAFAEAGAVQCGFCTPGMIISAKALLLKNPSPSRADVQKAIHPNICRCTGYHRIIDAILLAADLLGSRSCASWNTGEVLRADAPMFSAGIGSSVPRTDAAAKVLGTAEYADDLSLPGMVYGSAVRSQYPRARVKRINVTEALASEGVLCVLRAEDIPGQRNIGHLKHDWDGLIAEGEITRYIGDAIVLVAASTMAQLQAAKALVKIEYDPLPPVKSPEEALAEGAPRIHPDGNLLSTCHLVRGDAERIIQESAHVVRNHYSTPFTEHAFLEPETAVALPEADGIRIYCGDQGVFQTLKECALLLGLPEEKVRVTAKTVGGGFGGKEDMTVQHHAALLAYHLQKPVKVSLSRAESLLVHPKRHAMEIDVTTACDENGMLTAMKAVIIADTGAYASLGGPVIQRACTHAAGPYNYHHIDILGKAVYTNNPPAGAFRGFGVPQSCFATECNLNLLAERVGISPFEIRYRNAIRPGQVLPNGQTADESTALVETLDAIRTIYQKTPNAGIACAMKNTGLGVGIPDIGRCRLQIARGKIHIYSSAACIGQGLATVLSQIVHEVAGISMDQIVHEPPDTFLSPDSGNTTASRQTVFTGEATRRAAEKMKKALIYRTFSELEGESFLGEFSFETDAIGSEKSHPVSHIHYGYATQLVALDQDGKIQRVVAAHDVGRAINPKSILGQVEGGVVMSLGYALTENFPLTDCVPTAKFGTLGLFRAGNVPVIETILIEKKRGEEAFGAKGIGELCSIPTAPAVQHAYYQHDGIFRTKLPLEHTPYRNKK